MFTRRDGVIRHFWSVETGGDMADLGQDPPWHLLDTTPEGRGNWYPKPNYD